MIKIPVISIPNFAGFYLRKVSKLTSKERPGKVPKEPVIILLPQGTLKAIA